METPKNPPIELHATNVVCYDAHASPPHISKTPIKLRLDRFHEIKMQQVNKVVTDNE